MNCCRRFLTGRKLLSFWTPIILGCAFLIVPVSPATSSTRSAAQFGSSPSVPQDQTKERPNPVRRFFSWLTKVVTRPFRKRVPPISDPPIVLITSSTSLISFCPPWMRSPDNCSTSREVQLFASAGGPDVDGKLLYAWSVSAGHIRGEGQKVIWDLSDAADGTYTANVEVNAGSGLIATASTKVTIALCQSCMSQGFPCPTVAVSCPENAKSNRSMTFEAHVYGGNSTVKVTYTWSVSAGKISSGQGTSMITVDASDVTQGSITATVSIGGHEPGCVNTASCTTRTAGGVAKAGAEPF
jgi:PKD domain-containing protein